METKINDLKEASERIDPEKALRLILKQEIDLSAPYFSDMCRLFEVIEEHCRQRVSAKSTPTLWACWYAYLYGRIEGIRAERKRRNNR